MTAEQRTCSSCQWHDVVFDDHTGEPIGLCRRYPPRLVPIDDEPVQMYPNVAADDWCGEWSEPTKLTFTVVDSG
jgi:hypothetical protein